MLGVVLILCAFSLASRFPPFWSTSLAALCAATLLRRALSRRRLSSIWQCPWLFVCRVGWEWGVSKYRGFPFHFLLSLFIGTRRDEAKRLISESGLTLLSADDLDQAAKKAVAVSKIMELARQNNLRVSVDSLPEVADVDADAVSKTVVTPL